LQLDKIQLDKFQSNKLQLDKIQLDKFQSNKLQLDKIQLDKISVKQNLSQTKFSQSKFQSNKIQSNKIPVKQNFSQTKFQSNKISVNQNFSRTKFSRTKGAEEIQVTLTQSDIRELLGSSASLAIEAGSGPLTSRIGYLGCSDVDKATICQDHVTIT
jgi:hypothetical protein